MAIVRTLLLRSARVDLILGEPIDHPRAALYAAVNARGVLASGFGGAIRLAAGGDVERELRAQSPLLVGEAYLTGPGQLSGRGVSLIAFGITTRAPGLQPRRDAAANALTAALDLMESRRVRALTLPEVATRVIGIDLAGAATILADALAARLRRGTTLDEIAIVGLHHEYLRHCRDRLVALGATDP